MRRGARGQTLIVMLVAVAIIAILGVILLRPRGADTAIPVQGPQTIPGQSIERGRTVECRNNLNQIRQAVSMRMMMDPENGSPPASLNDLSAEGIGPQLQRCPSSQQYYAYDAASGRVGCRTPGHEQF
jgi:hypothetical protein